VTNGAKISIDPQMGHKVTLKQEIQKTKIVTLIFGPFQNVNNFFTLFSGLNFLNQKGAIVAAPATSLPPEGPLSLCATTKMCCFSL
jgi:hypothetical protein